MRKQHHFESTSAFGGATAVSRRLIVAIGTLAVTIGAVANTFAQAYPTRPITLVVPYPAAGSTNTVGRMVATIMQARLKQSVIVENRAGAGGYIGAEYVAKSTPDGYTLLLGAGPIMHTGLFTKGQAMVLSRDLAPIASVAQVPLMALAATSIPVKNAKDFVAFVKANPKRYNAGIVPNSTSYLDTITFMKLAGVDMVEIPHNSAADNITAMARGDVHLHVTAPISAKAMIDAGKIVPLAVGSKERFPLMPDVPTFKEVGYDMVSSAWYAVLGPLKLPADVVNRIQKEISEAMDSQESQDTLKKLFFAPFRASPAQIQALINEEAKQYAAAAKAVGLEPQ